MKSKSYVVVVLVLACSLCSCSERRVSKEDVDRVLDIIDSRSGGIPEDFPEDIPVYPQLRGVDVFEDVGYVVLTASSDDPVQTVVSFYERELGEQEWNQDEEKSESSGMILLQYSKDTRKVEIAVSRDQWDMTGVILTAIEPPSVELDCPRRPDSPEAREIMNRMAEVYLTCSAYRDKGTVLTTSFYAGDTDTEEVRFMTAFVRPDRFRFEFVEDSDRYIVHSDSSGTRTWWDLTGLDEEESLDLALAGATGVSMGAAHTIPSLLLNEKDSHRLTDLTELTLLPDEKLGGVLCHRIEGKNWRGDTESLWIDKTTYLLRRIDEASTFPGFRTEDTTIYSPQVDTAISSEELEFNQSGLVSKLSLGTITTIFEDIMSPELILPFLVTGSGFCLVVAGCLALIKRKRGLKNARH